MSAADTFIVVPRAIELVPLAREIERRGHAADRVRVGRLEGRERKGPADFGAPPE